MDILIPLKKALDALTWAEINQLSIESGVPFHTLAKIRRGETKDPGVLTCEKILGALHGVEIKQAA